MLEKDLESFEKSQEIYGKLSANLTNNFKGIKEFLGYIIL